MPRRPPPPDNELAFRFRESTFRLYEPYIRECVLKWPTPVAINPAPLRATTFAARLRDALLRLQLYNTTTDIDLEVFDRVSPEIVVVHRDQTVAIGPKVKKGRLPGAIVTTAHTAAGIHWESSTYTEDDVRAAVSLLGKRLLVGPLYVLPLSPPFQDELESSFDCSITTLEKHSIIF